MAARVCATCEIAYPFNRTVCEVCKGQLELDMYGSPTERWWDEVVEARARLAQGITRPERITPEERVIRWRAKRLEARGIMPDTARYAAARRADGGIGGFVLDVRRFEQLCDQGCPPMIALDILT